MKRILYSICIGSLALAFTVSGAENKTRIGREGQGGHGRECSESGWLEHEKRRTYPDAAQRCDSASQPAVLSSDTESQLDRRDSS